MAEGLLRALARDRFEAHSAGTKASTVNPLAIEAMREIGIDISSHRSSDNAKVHCPIFPGPSTRHHWSFEDPAEATGSSDEQMAVFRKVRAEIAAKIRQFLRDPNTTL
jgi:arsenate reductase